MKILQINTVCKSGSTGRIMYDIYTALKEKGEQSYIIYGRGDKINDKNIYKVNTKVFVCIHAFLARITGLNGYFSNISTHKVIKLINRENPDIVHLHNLHGYYINIYILLLYLKENHIKTVLTLHDEFMYTGKCAYTLGCDKYMTGCKECQFLKRYPKAYIDFAHLLWKKKKDIFEDFSSLYIATNSQWLANQLSNTILSSVNTIVINNGLYTDVFYPRYFNSIRNKYGITLEKSVLSISDDFSDKRKGLKYILQVAERNPNIQFILVGMKEKTQLINCISLPFIADKNDLVELYSFADTFLITSISDTFPTVCLESLACGTPIVGFDTGGTPETAPSNIGKFVPFGDVDELEKAVIYMIQQKEKLSADCRKYAEDNYNIKTMTDKYIQLYKSIIENNEV